MISVKSSYRSGTELAAFPDSLIDFYRMYNLSLGYAGVKTLLNRPDLDHWILAIERQVSVEDMITYLNCNAYADMNRLSEMYSVIPAGNRRTLKRKTNGFAYLRPTYDSSLKNIKWVSAKYVCVGQRQVLFMQSPILLFDSSVSSFFIDSWFSAFVSLLSNGVLDVIVSYAHFCLGAFKINPFELESC